MYIPTIYVLLAAELMLVIIGIAIFLGVYAYKLAKRPVTSGNTIKDETNVNLGTSYIEYLEKELLRNEEKSTQQLAAEDNDDIDAELAQPEETETPAANNKNELLQARQLFLNMERAAAEHIENEHNYWDSIYSGMQEMLAQFKTVETEKVVVENEIIISEKETKEKVFYIETQGKKVDGEVNKLKDIISEQENTLNSLRKSLKDEDGNDIELEGDVLEELANRLNEFERQLADSKMCMEVLELENDRLQEEINGMEQRFAGQQTDDNEDEEKESTSMIGLDQMKEVLEKQEQQIQDLHSTIENLEIDAQQAERLKSTINDFTRTSQEMMGCISILEEENEMLKDQLSETDAPAENSEPTEAAPANNEVADELKSKLKGLEQEIIKKDVAYAKLQDEYSSMEKEYLSMYEAIHGDNS